MRFAVEHNILLLGLLGFFFLLSIGLMFIYERERKAARRNEEIINKNSLSGEGNLTSRITHEIGNPLSVIHTAATELIQRTHDEVIKQDLAHILVTVDKLSKIVTNARNYLYKDQGLEEDLINFRKLVDDVLLFYSQLLEKNNIELYLKNLDNIFVECDRAQLEQLLLDLVRSSIEEVELLPEKWIEISALESHEHVYVRVRNAGNGLPAEIANKIANWNLTKNHGGDIHFEEAPHTTFILDLPVPYSLSNHVSQD